ncbi:EpsG family protein [Aminivibrio sp.]|uniref:EpsG family protein n=1 Tax=Aminivibrio sp. TaxID=1872489 RepID=UPI001A52C63B|nr:EpsG family protein [Aminivibrio sp.]MBL3538300.1 EpsG family protein [Aminivibrio sp.]
MTDIRSMGAKMSRQQTSCHVASIKVSKKNIVMKCFIIAFFLVAIFQLFGVSRDYENYARFFSEAREYGFSYVRNHLFEPLFSYLSFVVSSVFKNNVMVYSLLAILSFSIKCFALRRVSRNWFILFVALTFYGARFFPLHEMTQIRASFAASFLILAMVYIYQQKNKRSLLCGIATIGFHLSSLVIVPFACYLKKHWRKRDVFFLSIVFFVLLLITKVFLLDFLASHISKLDSYQSLEYGGKVSWHARTVILDILLIICGFSFWKRSDNLMRQILFSQVLGILCYYVFWDYAVLAHRIRELLSIFWVLYFPLALNKRGNIRRVMSIFIFLNIALYFHLYFVSVHKIF